MTIKPAVTLSPRFYAAILAALAVAALALLPALTHAAAPNQASPPQVFIGAVTINGVPAPQGTEIAALIDGVSVATAEVNDEGNYSLTVADQSAGATVTFTVNGQAVTPTGTVEVGGLATLALSLTTDAAPTPEPTATPDPAATPEATAEPTATPEPAATPEATAEPTAAPAPEPTAVPTALPTPTPTPVPPPTAVPPTFPNVNEAFRIGPTVRLRPVNDLINAEQDGLVEVLFRNPQLNDATMVVDLTVFIPSGFHIYGEGMATDVAAGAASGTYEVPPGQSRTVFLNLKAEKVGRSTLQFSGLYWPKGNKDLFNPISLTHPFEVIHPSADPYAPPAAPAPTQAPPPPAAAVPTIAPPAPPALAPQAPAAAPAAPAAPPANTPGVGVSCNAPAAPGQVDPTAGLADGALLLLPLLGLAGMVLARGRRRP